MHPNFKLLINNPILETANYISIKSEYINQCLSSYLYLPQITSRPFIFSCFALSVDGKLNYPDLKSGFAIAKYNLAATEHERYADWWILQLARSISDAVIIGSNSLNAEPNDYVAQIQAQAQTEDQLAFSANQGYQGVLRSVYLNGNWTGIVKADQTGNDELYFNGYSWMIYHVIEIWPDWCHVLVAQQTKSTVVNLSAFPGLVSMSPQASVIT